jgi:hypothetical protein
MTQYIDEYVEGERSLFAEHDSRLSGVTFGHGESPLKESRNIELVDCSFTWKYPLWYSRNIAVRQSIFESMARSGIWYTKDISMSDCVVQAEKIFRRCNGVELNRVHLSDANETLWSCDGVRMSDIQARGDYFGMNSTNIVASHLNLVGNYCFDGARNVEIHDSTFIAKDAFWNCENVTIVDSKINGEYLGWNTKNLELVNCIVESDQGLCYVEGLTLKNCRLVHTDLAFEYCSDIDADVRSTVDSVKNPISGRISAQHIEQLIRDERFVDPNRTEIVITR